MRATRLLPALLIAISLPIAARPASAEDRSGLAARRGRPRVVLDDLGLPASVERAALRRGQLRRVLAREARRVDWGAGQDSRIVYRFYVTELTTRVRGDVVTVSAAAVGRLPKGKIAKSQIVFSGQAGKQEETVNRVLEILARGVLTRLAELERIRRGQLAPSSVRRPAPI